MDGSFISLAGSQVNIIGGSTDYPFAVGTPFIVAGEANISLDAFVQSVNTVSSGVVNVSGGSVGLSEVSSDGVVNVSGGSVDIVSAGSGGVVNVSGGSVTFFAAQPGSVVNLSVQDAFLDGVVIPGLTRDSAFTILQRQGMLSGWLADGSEFSYELDPAAANINLMRDLFSPDATLTVTLVPPPGVLVGDVNIDGVVNFGDIPAFIAVLTRGIFQAEADIDQSHEVNFLDIPEFIAVLMAQ